MTFIRKLFAAASALALAALPAAAQQTVPMPAGVFWLNSTVWSAASASNPLPVTLESSGGTSNVNVLQWDTTALGAPTAWGSGSPSGNVISTNTAVLDWAGGTLGAMANYGTSPGAVLTPGVNAYVTNTQIGVANFVPAQVSVGATATLIVAARTGAAGIGRKTVCVTNTGSMVVYLGGSGVTTSTGDYLAGVAGAGKCFDTQAAIYGIVGTGSETVSETETY